MTDDLSASPPAATPDERVRSADGPDRPAATVPTTKAGEVGQDAAAAAQQVTEVARDEVVHVAREARNQAKDLFAQARTDLMDQAGVQQQKVAEGLRAIGEELGFMAENSDQRGLATDLVREGAQRSSAIASWLDRRDPGSLLEEVRRFARQRPGTFLAVAAGAGILAGRLTRGLSAGAPETAPRTPPPVRPHRRPTIIPASSALTGRTPEASAPGATDTMVQAPPRTDHAPASNVAAERAVPPGWDEMATAGGGFVSGSAAPEAHFGTEPVLPGADHKAIPHTAEGEPLPHGMEQASPARPLGAAGGDGGVDR